VGVTGYDVYQNGVFRANTASTTYAVTGLTAATAYSFYVIAKMLQTHLLQATP
jgi:chitodextrinase